MRPHLLSHLHNTSPCLRKQKLPGLQQIRQCRDPFSEFPAQHGRPLSHGDTSPIPPRPLQIVSRAAQHTVHHATPLAHLEAAVLSDSCQCSAEELGHVIARLQEKHGLLQQAEAESNVDLLMQFLEFSRYLLCGMMYCMVHTIHTGSKRPRGSMHCATSLPPWTRTLPTCSGGMARGCSHAAHPADCWPCRPPRRRGAAHHQCNSPLPLHPPPWVR